MDTKEFPEAASRKVEIAWRSIGLTWFYRQDFASAMTLVLNHHRLLILTKDLAQSIGDFAHGSIGLDGVDDGGH